MLIAVSEPQLSDGEVVGKFASIRSQILKLVKSTWRRDKFKPEFELTNNQMRVFGSFTEGRVDMRVIDNRIRSIIFQTLHDVSLENGLTLTSFGEASGRVRRLDVETIARTYLIVFHSSLVFLTLFSKSITNYQTATAP